MPVLFAHLDSRVSSVIRLIGLALVSWSVWGASQHSPGLSGRPLVVLILFAIAFLAALAWIVSRDITAPTSLDNWVLAAAGSALIGASPDSAASAFSFVAIITAGVRDGTTRALQIAGVAGFALAVSVIVYDGASIGLLAYVLGFVAAAFAGGNGREVRRRADQAELLLAQTQRSQEESLRAARLQESTRIAREIHDVLAHALAGLTIQLEATTALIENGAGSEEILARVRRAHELARDGLRETRRAVGALRDGGEVAVPDALRTLVSAEGARLSLDGDPARLRGDVGAAVLRVVQESLTNVAKHAPGAQVAVDVDAGPEEVVAAIESTLAEVTVAVGPLARSGGGYGIAGMRERASELGGTLAAGPTEHGWRVELRVPTQAQRRAGAEQALTR